MKEAQQQKKLFFNRLMVSFLVAVFSFGTLSAQVKSVSGVIKDPNGETIIGASVVVKGTTVASITDLNGSYKLNVPENGKVLVISYIGMEKQEIPIRSNVINVTLQNNDKSLDEVVVIGYGTQKKRDLTGSVSSVSEKELRDIPVSTVAEALTGKLPGVQVTTTEGSPDAEIKIRVRGGGSITQSNSPLYIVDGFAKDDIKDIAPSEIQTVDVLKDASSTAIYGSRGANGVIIITTKSGGQGKLTLNYTGYTGFKQVSKILDVLTPYQFARKQYERAVWNNSVSDDYEAYFGSFNDMNLYNDVNPTNWQKEAFGRTGYTQNHNLSLSGGSKMITFNVNFSHIDDKAIMIMSDYRRDNISAKVNINPLKWLKIDLSARYAGTTVNGSGANDVTGTEKSTSDSRVKNAVVYTPIPLKNLTTQNDDVEATASLYSPLKTTADNNRFQKTKDFNVNGGISVNITKDLSVHSTFGMTKTDKIDNRFFGLTSYYVQNGGAQKINGVIPAPAVYMYDYNTTILQNTNTVNYKKDNIFPNQDISVVVGQETYIRSNDYVYNDIEALPVTYNSFQAWDSIKNGTNRFSQHFYNPDERMLSYFGRINYDINGKYLFAAVFRADGSSKFSNGNQWGYFPSASAGWRISEEGFMKGAQDWLSNLKLRASLGQSGNNRIDNSAFIRSYSLSSNNYLPVSLRTPYYTAGDILANKDLKWETTTTRNAGLDFGFFKNRINGSFEVYSNTTSNVLIKMKIGGVGYTEQWQNVGQTSNKGAELNLNAIVVQTKDFNLSFGFNISTNVNNVDNLGTLSSYTFNETWAGSMAPASNSYIVTPGNPVGLIYGFVNDGLYPANDFKWNGSNWVMNDKKYITPEIIGYNGTTPIYKYKDANGVAFIDNTAIDGKNGFGPGSMKLKDINGDGQITDADRQLIGNANPKHYGAFNMNATYKGFDVTANFNWVYGNNIYNANKIELTSLNYKDRNELAITANSYSQIDWSTGKQIYNPIALEAQNANATMWMSPTGQYAVTSWAIEDGSFLRLNNLTVGYTLPAKFTKKFYVQKLRIYASGYNLWILTKYTGYDPEVDTRRATPATPGVDYSAYPKSRSYNVGVNITF